MSSPNSVWLTDDNIDFRVDVNKVEETIAANPNLRRGRKAGVMDKREENNAAKKALKQEKATAAVVETYQPRPTVAPPALQEFDYEAEAKAHGMGPSWVELDSGGQPKIPPAPPPSTRALAGFGTVVSNPNPNPTYNTKKLFLVEGAVRMTPTQAGRGAAQADQRRVVWSYDVDTAIRKFYEYFQGLSNSNETYVVLNAVASEAIE